MIQSLQIHNFQSHKNTFIEFGKNVNIFIGFSDSGKTAIIRALRWVITNKPSGDAFRSNWGGDTIVILTLVNGTKVRRTKGNSTNEYELIIKGADPLVFKAFGTDVPVEIEKALSFDSINLQEQLDAPYLLSETPGTVAKHFNKIAKLEKIDTGIQYVQSIITKLTQEINTNTSNIESYKESYKQWDFLQDFETKLEVLEGKVKSRDEIGANRKLLVNLYTSLEEVIEEQSEWSIIIKSEKTVTKLLMLYSNVNEYKQTLRKVKSLINSLENNAKEQSLIAPLLKSEITINKLIELHKERKETIKVLNEFNNLTERINKLRSMKDNALDSLAKLEEEYHRDFLDICPLCNSKIK